MPKCFVTVMFYVSLFAICSCQIWLKPTIGWFSAREMAGMFPLLSQPAEWEWWTRSKHFKTIYPKVGVHTNCISSVVPVVSHRAPPWMPFTNVTMGGKTHPQKVGWLLGVSHEFGVDTAQGRLVNTAEGQTHSFRIRIVIKVGPNEYVADAGCDSMTTQKTHFVALVNSNIWAAIAILCKPSSFSKLTVEDF